MNTNTEHLVAHIKKAPEFAGKQVEIKATRKVIKINAAEEIPQETRTFAIHLECAAENHTEYMKALVNQYL